LKLALVLGVNETIFPRAGCANDFDGRRPRRNEPIHWRARPDLRERLARERYFGYIACTRASERLVVTFSRHDTEDKTLNPSPFIAHLRRIFPGLDIEESSGEIKLADAEHVSEIAPSLMAVWSSEQERRPPARHDTNDGRQHAVPEAGAPSRSQS